MEKVNPGYPLHIRIYTTYTYIYVYMYDIKLNVVGISCK